MILCDFCTCAPERHAILVGRRTACYWLCQGEEQLCASNSNQAAVCLPCFVLHNVSVCYEDDGHSTVFVFYLKD